jgi:transposase-like protein
MNDVDTIDGAVKRATRRKHSAQFKANVVGACMQPVDAPVWLNISAC